MSINLWQLPKLNWAMTALFQGLRPTAGSVWGQLPEGAPANAAWWMDIFVLTGSSHFFFLRHVSYWHRPSGLRVAVWSVCISQQCTFSLPIRFKRWKPWRQMAPVIAGLQFDHWRTLCSVQVLEPSSGSWWEPCLEASWKTFVDEDSGRLLLFVFWCRLMFMDPIADSSYFGIGWWAYPAEAEPKVVYNSTPRIFINLRSRTTALGG